LLTKDFTLIRKPFDGSNTEDAAIAVLDPGLSISSLQLASSQIVSGIAVESPDSFEPQTTTKLLGSINPNATGRILTANHSTEVTDVPFVGNAKYEGFVLYETDCDRGDSGAAVVDDQNRLLGIHVAGSRAARRGLFFPVGKYLRDRNMTVVSDLTGVTS
jgi:hypothetical protein